jgi:hypothetical protein
MLSKKAQSQCSQLYRPAQTAHAVTEENWVHVKYGLHHPFDKVLEPEQLFTFKFKSIASLTLWHPLEAVNDFLVIAPR